MSLAAIGRILFAISMIAFGVQQFLFGDFVPGRAPAWPAGMPGRLLWAWLSGTVLVGTGAAIVLAAATPSCRRAAQLTALATGTMIFVWALLRQIPLAAADPSFGGEWTRLGKALMLFGGALAVAGSVGRTEVRPYGSQETVRPYGSPERTLIYLGRFCLGLFMIGCGIQHFLWVEFVTSLVPGWIPGALFWARFAGVALIAGGAGLMVPWTARLAGILSGLMVFVWFLILHIPRAVSAPANNSRNEWIAVFEALAVSGIAFVLSASAVRTSEEPELQPRPSSTNVSEV
jgi:uncharacterized membrane protein